MGDIELVIKIHEDEYNFIKAQVTKMGITDPLRICIASGIPLPKGHGDLKDVDELLKMTKSYKSELGRLKADPFVKCGIETVERFIKEMSPIIEAESEGKE